MILLIFVLEFLMATHPTNNSQKTSKNLVGAGSPTIYDTHKQSHKPAPFSPLFTSTISICQFLGGGVPSR